jgi:hypothetical protein
MMNPTEPSTLKQILRNVMSSAAEAKTGETVLTAKLLVASTPHLPKWLVTAQ